jgi:hypothetical protein
MRLSGMTRYRSDRQAAGERISAKTSLTCERCASDARDRSASRFDPVRQLAHEPAGEDDDREGVKAHDWTSLGCVAAEGVTSRRSRDCPSPPSAYRRARVRLGSFGASGLFAHLERVRAHPASPGLPQFLPIAEHVVVPLRGSDIGKDRRRRTLRRRRTSPTWARARRGSSNRTLPGSAADRGPRLKLAGSCSEHSPAVTCAAYAAAETRSRQAHTPRARKRRSARKLACPAGRRSYTPTSPKP